MYKDYFGLKEEPFSIAPDPQFLYMSARHREALAHLIYGMKVDSGFVLLTGEVGTGKTTVCRCLLGQIPENSEVAFILNPKLSVIELLATICDELGISYPDNNPSGKIFIDLINTYLLDAHSQGKKTVLIIDEAQNLSVDVLEQIRLLTNLETDKRKLLQVIMLGQPELNRMLECRELRQLAQRVTARYHLEPLSKNDIEGYLRHRLAVAGVERPLFPIKTVDKLYSLTGGVPRIINMLCDRALLGAYVKGENIVNPALLVEAANEVFGKKGVGHSPENNFRRWLLIALLSLILLFGITFLVLLVKQPSIDKVDAITTDRNDG
ncbi:MAG: AAA family ATPase [Desulfuromusa sp.]|nr:AAA family ATPase [Desulfuromusa sp.]